MCYCNYLWFLGAVVDINIQSIFISIIIFSCCTYHQGWTAGWGEEFSASQTCITPETNSNPVLKINEACITVHLPAEVIKVLLMKHFCSFFSSFMRLHNIRHSQCVCSCLCISEVIGVVWRHTSESESSEWSRNKWLLQGLNSRPGFEQAQNLSQCATVLEEKVFSDLSLDN